jgi:leucyl aminopeptidase (aminopeptidase T)
MVRSLIARACLLALSGVALASPAALASPVDTDALARRLVTAAAIKEGEIVLVSGQAHSSQLLEDIAVAVRSAGAFPIVTYDSDRLGKRLFFDVPARYDSQPDAAGLKLAGIVDVTIGISDGRSENLLDGADPKRLAERGRRSEEVAKAFLARKVRSVEVGNGFYPTSWRAERYGLSEDALAQTFWEGVAVDPSAMQARAAQVSSVLAAGNVMRVKNPNGTDFTVRIKDRRVLASDGAISAEDIAAGAGAVAVYLPAGEVYTTPVPGSANGTIVHSRSYFRGKPVENLRMEFKDGRMVSMTGSGEGYAGFRAGYDAVEDPRKDDFGFVDLGINPNVNLPANSQVGAWIPAGTISLGVGNNTWAGGDNSTSYGITAFLPGSTVTLDGKKIIDKGKLKL